jgi:hypothetical protein
MASNAFRDALRAAKQSKNLDKVLVGSSYLDEGTHDVTIQAVDTSAMDENRLTVTFVNEEGRVYTDRMFLTNRDGGDFSYGLRALWSAVLPDTNVLGQLLEFIDEDDNALGMLTGMKLRITLKPGKGFQVRSTGTGAFAAFDTESGEKITEEYAELEEAKDAATAAGHKRAFLRVMKSDCTHKESNIAAFNTAAEARARAASTNGGVVGSQFAAGAGVPKAI